MTVTLPCLPCLNLVPSRVARTRPRPRASADHFQHHFVEAIRGCCDVMLRKTCRKNCWAEQLRSLWSQFQESAQFIFATTGRPHTPHTPHTTHPPHTLHLLSKAFQINWEVYESAKQGCLNIEVQNWYCLCFSCTSWVSAPARNPRWATRSASAGLASHWSSTNSKLSNFVQLTSK